MRRPKRFAAAVRRLFQERHWRQLLLAAVTAWNRTALRRLAAAILASWLLGAASLHLLEGGRSPEFATWGGSLWNAWGLLFNGPAAAPQTAPGRAVTMLLLLAGVALAGLFTGTVASVLVERFLRRRDVSSLQMEGHLVLCNWTPRGLELIREAHSSIVREKRPIVVVHDNPGDVDLPDRQDDPAFADVYLVKGDPVNEVILRRAKVPAAHSVVVFSDPRLGDHADGKTILTCIAVGNVCRAERRPNVAAECLHPKFRPHLRKAGADEVISSSELGVRLMARAALFHGMTRVYQELLTVGRDANEMYLVPVPAALVGRDFVEAAGMFLRRRDDKRCCLLLGIQRGEVMMLNPVGGEAGPLRAGDELVLLSQVYPAPGQPLPTDPPLDATPPPA